MAEERIIDKIGKTLDFHGVFFIQLNRIMGSMSTGDGSHTNAIEGLEGLLSPYKDAKYREEMNEIRKNFKERKDELARLKNKPIGKLTPDDMDALIFNITKAKFASLMKLAARRRFLPELAIEEEI